MHFIMQKSRSLKEAFDFLNIIFFGLWSYKARIRLRDP